MSIKNLPNVKTKSLDFKITSVTKDAGGECLVEGYANTSTKDRVGDVVLPEAFAKCLPTYLKNPILLANHDWNDPIGKVISAEITDKGLLVKARISDTRPDMKTLIREGVLSTFSIGYNELDADFDESTKTKYVKELELLEISVVSVPANTEASFTEVTAKNEDAKPADDGEKAPAASGEEQKSAGSVTTKTAKDLRDFIVSVKEAVEIELDSEAVLAICEYVNKNEELMTKKELIDILKKKSAPVVAPAPEAAKADAPAADAAKPADDAGKADDMMKELMAKIDAMGQALAQLLEKIDASGEPDADDAQKADKPADEKPADEKPADDEEEKELSDAEIEKELAELDAGIESLENDAE